MAEQKITIPQADPSGNTLKLQIPPIVPPPSAWSNIEDADGIVQGYEPAEVERQRT